MGRLPKSGVDYFPHDVTASSSATLFVIQDKYGNDGYAFWFKLLEYLGRKANLYADFSEDKDWLLFLSLVKIPEEKANDIILDLIRLKAIDDELWQKHKIVWCENFTERLSLIYRKRGIDIPSKPVIYEEDNTDEDEEKASDKKKYANHVSMRPKDYDTLIKLIGEKATKACIDKLEYYKASNKKRYKSDYGAIRNWVIDSVKKDHPELFVNITADDNDDSNPFGEYDG